MAFRWYIAEPNEALIVSGKRGNGDGTEESQRYKIIASGDRVFVWPLIQSARTLGLDLKRLVAKVQCYTKQGVQVVITGVVAFKVGSDNQSIANAVQRFLHNPSTMEERVHEIFAGHIRGIAGGLTVEQLIQDRDALTKEARSQTSLDMERMGLTIDTLTIAEVDDPSGYINNLSRPDIARVEKDARVAEASSNREAAEQEAANAAQVAAAKRDSEIKQAGYTAEVEREQATAAQAGPLAAAQARKAVVEQETEVATLRASQREQELVSEVQKPADADRYKRQVEAEASKRAQILQAEAEAEATQVRAEATAKATEATGTAEATANQARGLADAAVTKAKGEAEGSALEARAKGLASESDAVIGQQVANQLPDIVKAAASAFDNVGNMTVLNGAEGLTGAMTEIMTMAGTALTTARRQLANGSNGKSNGNE